MRGHTAFDTRHHFIADSDISKRAAHHHFVVATARAVGIELRGTDLAFEQVFARRAFPLNATRRRDVIRGDGIGEDQQRTRAGDVGDRLRLPLHAFEEGWIFYIGAGFLPAICFRLRALDLLPLFRSFEHVLVAAAIHLGGQAFAHGVVNFLIGRPYVLQINVIAVGVLAERIGRQVNLERAGQRIGNDQRRRSKIVRPDLLMDAAFEVTVAGQHGADDEIIRIHRVRDLVDQRAGITDTGRAAEADDVKAERIEIVLQFSLGQIVTHHLAARRERCLHPRLGFQALGNGVAGKQPGTDQHRRVRCIGTAGNRRDDDIAVFDRVIVAGSAGELVALRRGRTAVVGNRVHARFLDVGQNHPVLRALRPGK